LIENCKATYEYFKRIWDVEKKSLQIESSIFEGYRIREPQTADKPCRANCFVVLLVNWQWLSFRDRLRAEKRLINPQVYTLLIIPKMWRELVKNKGVSSLVLNRNKDPFTNWRHASGIINKVYNFCTSAKASLVAYNPAS